MAHESEIGDYGGRAKAVNATGRITLILSTSCRVSSVRGHHFANTSVPFACKNHWALYCVITTLVHPNRQLVSSSAPSAPLGPAYRKSKYPDSRERAQICKRAQTRQDVPTRCCCAVPAGSANCAAGGLASDGGFRSKPFQRQTRRIATLRQRVYLPSSLSSRRWRQRELSPVTATSKCMARL